MLGEVSWLVFLCDHVGDRFKEIRGISLESLHRDSIAIRRNVKEPLKQYKNWISTQLYLGKLPISIISCTVLSLNQPKQLCRPKHPTACGHHLSTGQTSW